MRLVTRHEARSGVEDTAPCPWSAGGWTPPPPSRVVVAPSLHTAAELVSSRAERPVADAPPDAA